MFSATPNEITSGISARKWYTCNLTKFIYAEFSVAPNNWISVNLWFSEYLVDVFVKLISVVASETSDVCSRLECYDEIGDRRVSLFWKIEQRPLSARLIRTIPNVFLLFYLICS